MREDDSTVEVTGKELADFRDMFMILQGKPIDFAIILPEDIKAYVFESIETEIQDKNRIVKKNRYNEET